MKEFIHYVGDQINTLGEEHIKKISYLTDIIKDLNLPQCEFDNVEVSYNDDDRAETYIYEVTASCLFLSVYNLPMLIHYHVKHGYKIEITPKNVFRIQLRITKIDHYFKY